jgi:hypothetical protein
MKLHFHGNKLRFRPTLSLALIFVTGVIIPIVTSCGTETGNPIIKRPTTPRNVAQDTVESELIDLSESLADSPDELTSIGLTAEVTSPQLALTDSDNSFGLAENRSCLGDDSSVRTVFEKNKESSKKFNKKGYTLSVVLERKIETEWTSPGGAVKCTDGVLKKSLRLLKDSIETRNGKVKRSLSRTSTGESNMKTAYSSATFESQGNWKTTYSDVSLEANALTVHKLIDWKIQKSAFISTAEGESASESTSMTVEGSPLKVKIERARPGGGVIAKTIESGSTKTIRPDGSIVEVTFSKLVFKSGENCYPSEGKMSGKMTPAPTAGANPETFEIDFSEATDGIPEIVFSDLQRVPLSGACFEQ